jgi:hypothetical protein
MLWDYLRKIQSLAAVFTDKNYIDPLMNMVVTEKKFEFIV